MHKKTKLIISSSFLIICSIVGSYLAFSSFKPTITTSTTYPAYTIPELAKIADNIVYGKVKEKGETHIKTSPIVQGVNHITATEGTYDNLSLSKTAAQMQTVNYSEDIYTNVDIQIKTPLKLNGQSISNTTMKLQSILPYKEEGGEMNNVIYKSEDEEGIVNEGDELIIFTNKAGYNWGAQSILKVMDGIATDHNGNQYTINEIMALIQKNM